MLTRWTDLDHTFSVFDEFHRRMNQFLHEYERSGWRARPVVTRSWPAVNLYDNGDELMIQAQVPGLSEKEISLNLNQDVLTISGERKSETPEGYSVHRQERGSVKFSRSFSFPCKIDPEKTAAVVRDGVLTVRLSKAAEAKPRQITVKAR